jgi:hypothetical protein
MSFVGWVVWGLGWVGKSDFFSKIGFLGRSQLDRFEAYLGGSPGGSDRYLD